MLQIILTLDYEVHGNGEGSPYELMVEPTERLLNLFEQYGAKLTIMADTAEILKFRDFASAHKRDDYHYQAIVTQLQNAIRRGHDVQLHLHSSWLNARHDGRCWVQDWSEYNVAGLGRDRVEHAVGSGKDFLETTLRPVRPNYHCTAFRAGNWSVSPSRNLAETLTANGFQIDSSVFKYGRRRGLVTFDYSAAHSQLQPWRADPEALWKESATGQLWEVPIYSEPRWIGAFFSFNRLYRAALGRLHRFPAKAILGTSAASSATIGQRVGSNGLSSLFRRHAWKADFNQCTGQQLIRALRRAHERFACGQANLPFVLIGHSKLFIGSNARSLRPFLAFVQKNGADYRFGSFRSLELPALGDLATTRALTEAASAVN